jgi:hypothetical protein
MGKSASVGAIDDYLDGMLNKKTIQRRLKSLMDNGYVNCVGEKKFRTYRLADNSLSSSTTKPDNVANYAPQKQSSEFNHPIFSAKSLEALSYLDTPQFGRIKTSYNFDLLNDYIPNETTYMPAEARERMLSIGKRFDNALAAGTYAKQIAQRLLIDLSYNSSRLEGNTYTRLDTKQLIEQGMLAKDKVEEETVMIMNHKEAIQFIIESAEHITLSPFIIRNIHSLLSQDLLANVNACGAEREIEVFIGKSAYTPLNNPHQIKEYFSLLLLKAEKIIDPFEQSFFLLIQLSYLQAFEDVNKRTARLTCNIPFIKANLCPLSFVDVPQEDYFKALLYFYETNKLLPAIELFEWAYMRSCEQYSVVKESLGEIDSYRIRFRVARKDAMGLAIRNSYKGDRIKSFLFEYCNENQIESPEKFVAMTSNDLKCLHVGAIVGLGITEALFKKWSNE